MYAWETTKKLWVDVLMSDAWLRNLSPSPLNLVSFKKKSVYSKTQTKTIAICDDFLNPFYVYHIYIVFHLDWKLVDTTKEYEDGYAKFIQVQQNHYRWEMYKQKYKIWRWMSTKMLSSQLKKLIILSMYVQNSILIYAYYTFNNN